MAGEGGTTIDGVDIPASAFPPGTTFGEDGLPAQQEQQPATDVTPSFTQEQVEVQNVDGDNGQQSEELIGGKFKTQDDLLKAYRELERKQSQQTPEEAAGDTGGDASGDQGDGSEEQSGEGVEDADGGDPYAEVRELLTGKGLDVDALSQAAYSEEGLSADQYKQLEDAGFPKFLVDDYVAGQRAVQAADGGAGEATAAEVAEAVKNEQSLKAIAGGEEGFARMTDWAKQNLPVAEVAAFNKMIDTGDMAQARMAIQGLKRTYDRANGVAPSLRVEESGKPAAADVFHSREEQAAAMKDPRYRPGPQQDPAFVEYVTQKSIRSTFAGEDRAYVGKSR